MTTMKNWKPIYIPNNCILCIHFEILCKYIPRTMVLFMKSGIQIKLYFTHSYYLQQLCSTKSLKHRNGEHWTTASRGKRRLEFCKALVLIFSSTVKYIPLFSVFWFKDTLLNIHYWFINTELAATSTSTPACAKHT